jgi:hypothetical protein
MPVSNYRRITGALFITGAILVNVPYALLVGIFDYPDILRQPAATILERFAAAGSGLIVTWLAFAWVGLPLLVAIALLPRALERHDSAAVRAGTVFGIVGGVVQMIGLLRWVFVVPVLARLYTDPGASEAARQAAGVAFQALHQFGGVLLGEHLGQMFTILWMGLISAELLRRQSLSTWLGWAGIAAALVYLAAQAELLATVFPGVAEVPAAGLAGSLLWLGWMVWLGVWLMRRSADPAPSPLRLTGATQ